MDQLEGIAGRIVGVTAYREGSIKSIHVALEK